MANLTITFPQVKINLNPDTLTFDTLEQMIFEVSQDIARMTTKKALEDLDHFLKTQRPQGVLENQGKRNKHFLTRMGAIRYERTRYFDKTTGKFRYLLEEKLGIDPNQRTSLKRNQIEMTLVSNFPYRQAQEVIKLLTGQSRSHEATRQAVIQEGQKITRYEQASIAKTMNLEDPEPQTSHEIIYNEVDSTYIKLQRSKKRKTPKKNTLIKSKNAKKNKKRRRKSIEIKLGISYTGKQNRYPKGARLAEKLTQKLSFCDISNGPKFMEDLSLIAEKMFGLSKAKLSVIGGDGARWIKRGGLDYFANALYVLCRFHLCRNVRRALSHRKEKQQEILSLLRKDFIDQALIEIKSMIQKPKHAKEKKALEDLYRYISYNKEGINALERIQDKDIRSKVMNTGAIESNIDKFIAHRFKKRGMSWSKKGALSLLKIRQVLSNGQWDSWWTQERNQTIQINKKSIRTLTSKEFWKKNDKAVSLIEATLPVFQGPHQDRPWVNVLRELSEIKRSSEWAMI